ncbi:pancreatic lipase-related protein 2-like [Amblyomma americanum]
MGFVLHTCIAALVLLLATVTYGATVRNNDDFELTTPAEDGEGVEGRIRLPGKAMRFIGASVELLDSVLPGNLADTVKVRDKSNDSTCYPLVGCFRSRDPMTVPLSFPDSPEKVNTSLLLYSRQNRNSPLRLDWRSRERNERLNLFRERKPLKLIVHGWQETGDSEWVQEAKDSLLNLEDCNVIVVDWRGGSERGNYIRSAGNTALVGRQGSLLLQHLLTIYRQTLSTEDVHVIGHSLGGQVSGFLGRHFLNQTGVRLGRITALDAAAPLFEDTDVFLSSRDAQFVDAIHTSSGGKVIKGEFGILKPFGHVDFYPNGGQKQPGCPPLELFCDHKLSKDFFLESLRNRRCRFISEPCAGGLDALLADRCVRRGDRGEMGYFADQAPGRGLQTLETNESPPYCRERQVPRNPSRDDTPRRLNQGVRPGRRG